MQLVCLFRVKLEPTSQNYLGGLSGATVCLTCMQSFNLVRDTFSLMRVSNKVTGAPFCFPLYWLTSLIRYLEFQEFCSLCGILMMGLLWTWPAVLYFLHHQNDHFTISTNNKASCRLHPTGHNLSGLYSTGYTDCTIDNYLSYSSI